MDDALAAFLATLPEDIRGRLDYSAQSLDALEGWLLSRYTDPKQLLAPEAASVLDGAARYLGETIRKEMGGTWEIKLDDPKYVYYRIPQLTGFSPTPTPISPFPLITASIDRKTGTFLRTVVENAKKREAR